MKIGPIFLFCFYIFLRKGSGKALFCKCQVNGTFAFILHSVVLKDRYSLVSFHASNFIHIAQI